MITNYKKSYTFVELLINELCERESHEVSICAVRSLIGLSELVFTPYIIILCEVGIFLQVAYTSVINDDSVSPRISVGVTNTVTTFVTLLLQFYHLFVVIYVRCVTDM